MGTYPWAPQKSAFAKNLPHIIALFVLVIVLMFVLTRFGYLRCCDIPGFCGVYYAVVGQPRIAIIYGDEGTGDPEALRNVIIERTQQFPDLIPVDHLIGAGILDQYQMVIVERAKEIDTEKLYVFRDYVSKGGQLVWIGDAGTALGENDYICEDVTVRYVPSAPATSMSCSQFPEEYQEACSSGECEVDDEKFDEPYYSICMQLKLSGGQTVCGTDWISVPLTSEGMDGLCGQSFGEVVANFVAENKTLHDELTTPPYGICSDKGKEQYIVEGAERIEACLTQIKQEAGEVKLTASVADEYCVYGSEYNYGLNMWDRGSSTSLTGEEVAGFNFGATVLGLDYVGEAMESNLWFQPVMPGHTLIRGYQTRTDVSQFFGESTVVLVDASRYSLRSKPVMNLEVLGNPWPAIIISSPVGPLLTQKGLVVYYAFPPEVGAETGAGINLINNLIDFSICR